MSKPAITVIPTTMLPGLLRFIARWSIEWRPHWVRGEAGFSHDAVTIGLEARNLPCPLKLPAIMDVKRFVEQVFWRQGWTQAGEGVEGREGELALSGWRKVTRVIVLWRPLKGERVMSDESPHVVLSCLE